MTIKEIDNKLTILNKIREGLRFGNTWQMSIADKIVIIEGFIIYENMVHESILSKGIIIVISMEVDELELFPKLGEWAERKNVEEKLREIFLGVDKKIASKSYSETFKQV